MREVTLQFYIPEEKLPEPRRLLLCRGGERDEYFEEIFERVTFEAFEDYPIYEWAYLDNDNLKTLPRFVDEFGQDVVCDDD